MSQLTRREQITRQVLGGLALTATVGGIAWAWTSLPGYLAEPVFVARWILWILIAVFGAAALGTGLVLLTYFRTCEWNSYRKDEFFGLVWRWDWSFYNQVMNAWCFCPRCDRRMAYDSGMRDGRSFRTYFSCLQCGTERSLDGDRQNALAIVQNEIDLKVRHGTWKAASNSNAA